MTEAFKFDQVLQIGDRKLTKDYIQSLSKQERLDLIEPIFQLLRQIGWLYPDNPAKIKKSWKSLLDFTPDLSETSLFNNSSLATDICKHFCHSFYQTTERNKPTLLDNFNNDDILRKMIFNRLGLEWLDSDAKGAGVNEAFNLSSKMMIQAQRSMRLVNATSMFKPSVAKYMALKYSQPDDLIFDYSCGFGGRLLGTLAAGRRYLGTDPLTTPELQTMANFFQFNPTKYTLIASGSENYRGAENSVDLSYSSPPYFDQEYYSSNVSQAYNQGEDYFYQVYWQGTLNNVKHMLKPGKWFGLNVKNYPRMVEMAEQVFGPVVEQVALRTVRSHLNKTAGTEKNEYIYLFRKTQ